MLAVEVDVAEIERDGLGRAQTARVDELEQGAVAQHERPVPGIACPVDELLHLRERGCLRQAARPARRQRCLGHAHRAEGVTHERADGREPAGDRGGREPAARAAELGRVSGERPDVHLVELEPLLAQPARKVGEVGAVRPPGRVGVRGAGEEPLDRSRRVHGYGVLFRSPLASHAHPPRIARRGRTRRRRVCARVVGLDGPGTAGRLADARRRLAQRRHRPVPPGRARGLVDRRARRGGPPDAGGRRGAPPASRVARADRRRQPRHERRRRTEDEFRDLVSDAIGIVGTRRCLLWATLVRGGAPREGFNAVLEAARAEHSNVRLVDWALLVEREPETLAFDTVHGTPIGYARRAAETAEAARRCTAD